MGVRIYPTYYDSITGEVITWESLDVSEESVRNYAREYPMPKSKTYMNIEELIDDIKMASGPVCVLPDETKEFKEWLADLISAFL